ncbi:cation transport protein [Sphingobacterium spiritivorum ATCC 33300]|uniref:Cation transport protein n=2 Tax=Sphingobacterium spiritivorum TaxID=258 RepID=C2FSD6_SPHSI|nr:cation transport protein [Sphingobacterium spiritivorum ATCC 33300]QQS97929.1 ATPase [Sphingobacterium spiritivorum]
MLGFLKFIFKYKNKIIDICMFYVSMICAFAVILHVGYITDPKIAKVFEVVIHGMFFGLFLLEGFRTVSSILVQKRIGVSNISGLVIIGYFFFITLARLSGLESLSFFNKEEWIYLGIYLIFLSALSKNSLFFDNFYFNPTILFVISFLVLILIGTLILMLPRTTLVAPLTFIDALFMATSAVCITGLSVTDISSNFSMFGQTVILVLIQIGGLGIMTFTGFFGYFFSGGFSFKNQLMFGEILEENKLNSVISTLLTIIFITLLFEFIGAVSIYFTLDPTLFNSIGDQVFFSIFHAVSSFCNAGFSILPDGIQHADYRYNYNFQLALAMIFVFGGLGFGTVYNFYTYAKTKVQALFCKLILKRSYVHKPWPFSFNSKFILICNLILVVLATSSYFLFEYSNTLQQDETWYGKIVSAFFMTNASRSAGFNSINLNFLSGPTVIMVTSLMWIGASPGSTGGGVKVTTVAIALLNILSLARGKDSIDIFKRRIIPESVNKAFAIILLSGVTIGISFVLLNLSDPGKGMKELLFETVSAYTTCGLSLGVTPSLSPASKIIIIFTMFVGRVGTLTLLVAFIKNMRNRNYVYPSEKILF